MSEEERADDPAAAQKSVKKAVKKTVKKARKRAVKKAVAKKPKASKLERLTEKSIRVYEDYVRKAEVLQAFGADTSGLAEAMSRADGMKGTISATPELKEFLAVSKLVNGGLAEIQGAFVGELLATAQSEMDALAQRGTDVSNLHGSVNAQVGILSNVKASSNELNTALDQLNEIRIWIHGELEREETPVEATPEESPEAAFPTDEEEAEAGEPGMGEEETEEIGIQEGTVSEEAEPGVEPEKVLEEGAREELQEEVPAKEVPVEAGPTPEELQLEEDKQKAAILINETYMYLQSRQEETGLPLKEAIDILDRAGELVESGELETIGDLRPEVDRAIEAEIELRRTVGVELEKCRKDILAANQQGINLEEVTRLFSQAREMFDANDIAGARKAAKTINEDVERITGEFKETVARIEEVKSSINEAREREIDVSKEMNEFQSLKVFISHGEFSRAKELLATINESIIEKIKELVLNEIRQTRTILEKAPAYIDTTEPMAILDRAEEELGEGEVDKAAQSVGESKELAMKIRERYLKLVERSNEISGQLQKLKDAGLEIESLIDMFSSAKEELKEGDFSACEQHFEKTLQTIDDTQVRTYDELTAKINRVMEEVQEGLTGLGKRYPDKNISDLLDRNAGISVDYDRARDIGDLKDVDVELGTLKQALTEREKELETLVEREREQRIRDDFADKAQRCKMLLADIGGHENVRKEEKLVKDVLLGAKEKGLETALEEINEVYLVLVEMKKELDLRVEVALSGKGFEKGIWGEAKVRVMNCSSFPMSDVSVTLVGPFDTRRRIHFKYMEAQEILNTSLALKFSEVGRIPVDIKTSFTAEPDGVVKEKTFMGWIEVKRRHPHTIEMAFQSEDGADTKKGESVSPDIPEIGELAGKEKRDEPSPLDTCPVCKQVINEADVRYLCGCNQMYHKRCAEKVNNNACLNCGVALFEVENLVYLTCPVCRGDIWYDDEIFAHDCGEFYHRDCILGEGTCKNCYAPVDGTTNFLLSTCMVCHRTIRDDDDFRRCKCGEPYHSPCYRRVAYCVRCGADLKGKGGGKTSSGTIKKEEPEVQAVLKPVMKATETAHPAKAVGEGDTDQLEETKPADEGAVKDGSKEEETVDSEGEGGSEGSQETASDGPTHDDVDLDDLLDDLVDEL